MNAALLLAAGKSKRFKGDKLFAELEEGSVIFHSLKLLNDSAQVHAIFVAANSANKKKIEALVKKEKFHKVEGIILGGATRFESVKKLLGEISAARFENLIVHNAANPRATEGEISACLRALRGGISGVAVGRPVRSTLKKMCSGFVLHTLERNGIWETETPQVVRAKIFFEACSRAEHGADFTDDLAVLETSGFKTALIEASPRNKKITFRDDLPVDMSLRNLSLRAQRSNPARVGIGEDSHKFIENGKWKIEKVRIKKRLVLGGVTIKNLPALDAESDGDVILHALCNAISSALGGGSLGTFATKMVRREKIKDSKKFLGVVLEKTERVNCKIQNVSISIEAALPKIDPLSPSIKKSLSALLKIPFDKIGITATTGNGTADFAMRGIRCSASVLLAFRH